MFTGIIEEIGDLLSCTQNGSMQVIKINCKKVLEGVKKGDSIAVNGTCFTVVDFGSNWFISDMMNETFVRTAFKDMKTGSLLNLERALSLSDRLGGHIVSGHIDGTAIISSLSYDKNEAFWLELSADENIMKYIIEKGSVAIDGVSLTVACVEKTCFKVSVIPETLSRTTIKEKAIGQRVNIECDIIGKYVERFVLARGKEIKNYKESRVTYNFLKDNGF